MLKILCGILIGLNGLDIVLTHYGRKFGHQEKNPIANWGFKHIGFIPFALARLLLVIGFCILCVWYQDGFSRLPTR